jgi:serine/threonine protein kinase/Flp pilus assembly protein TadD
MSPGRALPKERAAQQARALECIYEAETTASGTGTSLAVLASRLGTSDHDANETLIGLVHRGEIIHDPASGEYRLTDNGRLEAARRFTLIPGSPAADAPKKTPREADDMTRLPSNDPDDQKTLVGGRPQTSDDDQQTIVGAPPGGSDDGATIVGGRSEPSQGDTGPLSVGERFGTRYRITKLLGVGGMGAVYEAWDGELGVSVALKVIRPEIAADSNAARELERRFKRELLLARQVTHPNVVRIHDLGEINGIKYITMPYIEGDDLGTILKTEGRLPVPRALAILRQALSGLVAAHKAGIVHRDLKPANIMVDTEGHALLMDFGIARSIGLPAEEIHKGTSHSKPGSFGETMVGAVVGTIHYMAPEQAKGQTVDHRADVYAFGLILRDTLVGLNRREGAPTALAELQKRLDAAPVSLKSLDATIPEPLDRIVTRCLAPDPAGRYQTTAELEADLNRLDDQGELIPVKRVLGVPVAVAISLLLVALSSGVWWYLRPPPLPVAHDPISVVIADLQNNTGDPTLDRALEPMFKRALENAGFINAYDRSGMSAFGVRPPEKMDETETRQIALKQGLGVVLSGSIDRQGSGYRISIKAAETVTGKVIADANGRASSKEQVLTTGAKLMTTIRKALGDDTSDSAQLFAMGTMSASSIEVLRYYAAGREAGANGDFEEARNNFRKAVELDPKFGLGYQNLAAVSQNLGNLQEAEKYIKEAVSRLDGMTERERYGVRALSFRITGDYQQCVKEYGDMVARYAADVNARNGLALCSTFLRNMPRALDEMRQVVKIMPKRPVFRINLALYESYAGNFKAGEQEARTVQELGNRQWGLISQAFAQLGQGQFRPADETYQELAKVNPQGASQGASGLGDLAVVEGRFSDAVQIFEKGAAADLASNNADTAAAKFASLAHVHLLLRQNRQAVLAAEKALANSTAVKIRFLAARVFVEAGETPKGQKLAAEQLASELLTEPRAYAKIIEGDAFLKKRDFLKAISALTEANTLLDTWIGHFDLGRAYFEGQQFLQADGEFDRCIKRRGEALSLFLDEEPTYGFFPAAYYYQGRVREALKIEGFADSYREYLSFRGESKEDTLLPDVRKRAGS